MSQHTAMSAKVKAYMESLSPAARSLVQRAIQNAGSRGEDAATAEAILAAMGVQLAEPPRRHVPGFGRGPAQAGQSVPARGPSPDRRPAGSDAAQAPWRVRLEQAVLAPVMPLAIDVHLPVKQSGRIARPAIDAIWTWIARDVAHAEVEAAAAHPADPAADPGPAARALRHAVLPLVLERLRQSETDPKAWQRLNAHLGGETVSRELRDVIYVLQRDTQFAALAAQLPPAIAGTVAESPQLVATIRNAVEQAHVDAGFVGAVLLPRLSGAWLLAPLALRLAGSHDPRLVFNSRYARLIDIALSEAERIVALAQARVPDRRERMRAGQLLRDFHDLLRNMQFAFEIETVPTWFKRIGAARRDLSDLAGKEIEQAPGLIRRALRVESLSGAFGGGFDPDTLDDAEFAVRLLLDARIASDNLALNDLLGRTRRQVEQTLEVVQARLMTEWKSNRSIDRDSLAGAVDGVIRLCGLVFGEDYAAVLRKGRDSASKPGGRA